jgi:hypothetical protein
MGGRKMIIWGTFLLWILGLFILYVVIFAAVKNAVDKSEVGQIVIKKYGVKKEIIPISDEEIEKELEDDERR